ncbi:MAG: S41 family peptidase [Cyanobacteria bacterium P01_F01_bin.53]
MSFKRYKTWLKGFLIATLIALSSGVLYGANMPAASEEPALFEAVWETINEHFYDPNFNGVDWATTGAQYRSRVAQASSKSEQTALINTMLSELNTSHTQLYTPDDPAYYQLLGIFYPRVPAFKSQLEESFPDGEINYTGIGAITRKKGKKTFVQAVLNGSPADTAGLKAGDQILSVEGEPFEAIQSFLNKADQPVNLQVQSTPNENSQREITVTPRIYDGITMFIEAMDNSVEVIEKSGQQIGYVHIWSYAGDQYHQLLEDELFYGRLKDADALVLDLRDGWGGAQLDNLNLYTARGPSFTSTGRDREPVVHRGHWDKPVVMLVNEGSRSGKEILAYGFQQYDIGPVVGVKTAGAVTAGRAFIMPDSSLLYVAVADVHMEDNTRLEGVGITPDVLVPFHHEYSQGVDPQKERAIATAIKIIQGNPLQGNPLQSNS